MGLQFTGFLRQGFIADQDERDAFDEAHQLANIRTGKALCFVNNEERAFAVFCRFGQMALQPVLGRCGVKGRQIEGEAEPGRKISPPGGTGGKLADERGFG